MINTTVCRHVLQVMEDGEASVRTLGSAMRTVKQSEEDESQEERKDQGHFPRLTFQPHVTPLVSYLDLPLCLNFVFDYFLNSLFLVCTTTHQCFTAL